MELWRSPLEVIEDGCCLVCSFGLQVHHPCFNPDNLVKVTSSPVTAPAALSHPVYSFNYAQMQLLSAHPLFHSLHPWTLWLLFTWTPWHCTLYSIPPDLPLIFDLDPVPPFSRKNPEPPLSRKNPVPPFSRKTFDPLAILCPKYPVMFICHFLLCSSPFDSHL
ncbi:hypothetical protein K435DRAFT_881457 [Dendrothele bispora CBS 962.96]|uniref:Uncharacterized protein n=1 Tax=Dendrothele bispora (strain CBS 962.96) TaxID=1314807 RepID=A0A4S8KIM5_DENBC|nr:hypothetical protein K435DRAFT_881457 [Dendrothele bispora CBS 962.96]